MPRTRGGSYHGRRRVGSRAGARPQHIALGVLYPDTGAPMAPLSDAFTKVIRVLIAPILFCAVVHGIAGMASLVSIGRLH